MRHDLKTGRLSSRLLKSHARTGVHIQTAFLPALVFIVGSAGYHGAVVGAEFEVRKVDLVRFTESTSEGVTKGEIGGDAAGEQDGFGLGVIFDGFFELSDEDFDGGGLEAGGKIVDLLRA